MAVEHSIQARKSTVAGAVTPLAVRAALLCRALAGLDAAGRLSRFCREVRGPIVFTTSFGLEGRSSCT